MSTISPTRAFTFSRYSDHQHVNIGTGVDISIAEFTRAIVTRWTYSSAIAFDTSRPDVTPRKLLYITRLSALSWQARTPLGAGLACALRRLPHYERNRSVQPR